MHRSSTSYINTITVDKERYYGRPRDSARIRVKSVNAMAMGVKANRITTASAATSHVPFVRGSTTSASITSLGAATTSNSVIWSIFKGTPRREITRGRTSSGASTPSACITFARSSRKFPGCLPIRILI